MKKSITKICVFAFVATVFFSSCTKTMSTSSREQVAMPGLKVKRADYKLTSDVSAEAEVKVTKIFGLKFISGADKKNVKVGEIVGGGSSVSVDEKLAVYNLIEKNPDFDYITNVRYVKTLTSKCFGITKIYKTKVIAKGIILNTDK